MRPGEIVGGRFVIGRVLGRGHMGTVYEARDQHSSTLVAIKVLTNDRDAAAGRFTREATVQASLVHENIVRHVAHGTTATGVPYLVMERIDGEDLGARLERGPLTVAETLGVARGVAAGLAAAHARGIIHRDVKPANVLLPGGDLHAPKLTDFGVARVLGAATTLTRTGHIVGTPSYMAPEQAHVGREVDELVDVFALGCVLYHCLAGRPPFEGTDVRVVLAKILFSEAPPLRSLRDDVPAPIEALVVEMMAKDPTRRPRSSADVRAAVDRIAATTPPT